LNQDTMSCEQRLQAVINLQVPDRVPVCPFIYHFAAGYAGITIHELWSDHNKYRAALEKCYEELGPWDVYYATNPRYPEMYTFIMPMKARWPGIDLPPDSQFQLLEEEIMLPEDYRWTCEMAKRLPQLSYTRFFMKMISRIWDNIEPGWMGYAQMLPRAVLHLAGWRREFDAWKRKGVAVLHGFLPEAPFDTFSLARGFVEFAKDLRRRPGEIAEAAEALTEGYVFISKLSTVITGVKRVELFIHRSSNTFISPAHFRALSLPSLKRLTERLVEEGLRVILHLDGNWDLNLEALRELPAGNCIAQFDGPTDIFLAKRILGDRMCIMGDVPATMLSFGSPSEVDEYCHRLIEEVGSDGGYIMGAGCEIPPDAKPENVRVMIDSVRKYGYYR